jgi:hypothetical protein
MWKNNHVVLVFLSLFMTYNEFGRFVHCKLEL